MNKWTWFGLSNWINNWGTEEKKVNRMENRVETQRNQFLGEMCWKGLFAEGCINSGTAITHYKKKQLYIVPKSVELNPFQ